MSTEKIKIIYEKNAKNRGADIFTPLLVILLVASVFTQLYSSVQKQLLHKNIDEKKCNPRYIFFSGFLNPLDRDPWTTSQSNFQKCVAKNIYQDVKLTRDINQNKYLIQKNKMNLKQTLDSGRSIVRDIKDKWEQELYSKQNDIYNVSSDNEAIFEEQGTLYQEVMKKSTQLFNVIKSILIYIEGIIQLKVSEHKTTLNIDTVHEEFMSKYTANYRKYGIAYDSLDNGQWTLAINTAREAIQEYEDMTQEVEDFMKKNAYLVASITENCYQLKYNMDNDSCGTVFPNLNKELVAHYPMLKKIF